MDELWISGLAILEADADAVLSLGLVETGAYGNGLEDAADEDGQVTFGFEAASSLVLEFDAYDVDSGNELLVSVNGTEIAAVPAGIDEGLSGVAMEIPGDLLVAGMNELTFTNAGGAEWTWGVTNILLVEAVTPELTPGVVDTGSYGNGFDGLVDSDGTVEFGFESDGSPLVLEFDGYDLDAAGEVAVRVNGVLAGLAPAGADSALAPVAMEIPADLLVAGSNVLTFTNEGGAGWTWGVANVLLQEAPPPPELVVGSYETGAYGNGFEGSFDTDGEVAFGFGWDGGEDLVLAVRGYDIDSGNEVEVRVNGVSAGFLDRGESDALEFSSLVLSAELLAEGENTLAFVQAGEPSWTWGVTDILLLNAGINDTEITVDPEFTQDGYVSWVTQDAVVLGRIDKDTGALIEVLNVSDEAPQPVNGTYNGPEVIVTAQDGPGAIAVAEDGLIYINAEESRMLENTFGYRTGLLPKGELPQLRFTMIDEDGNVFLWDEGVVTPLEIGDPEAKAATWLNAEETVVFAPGLVQVYNVATGEMTFVTDGDYEPAGNIAALETEAGRKVIALYAEDHYDFWVEQADGSWALEQTSWAPYEYDYLQSPELFEWEGYLWLSGTLSLDASFPGEKLPALYNVDLDQWTSLQEPGSYIDPEAIGLNDGKVVYYYSDLTDQSLHFFVATLDEVMANALPSAPGNAGGRAEVVAGATMAAPVALGGLVQVASWLQGVPAAGPDGADLWEAATAASWSGLAAEADLAGMVPSAVRGEPGAGAAEVADDPAEWAAAQDSFIFAPRRASAEHRGLAAPFAAGPFGFEPAFAGLPG